MRRSIITIIIMIAFAAVIKGQDFDSMKICVNPGHGGHDSDDRYIAATGFWESEGNLTKGLYLRDMLEAHNAVVIMTRVLNRTEDDLPLSTICAIANNNNVDWMHSIHSNGYQGTSNYTLLLYRGKDGQPKKAGSDIMGGYLADEIWKAHRTTAKYNRGDWSFYGTEDYLGVLRTLNMSGTLSEGSFHDYIPESWRLKNDSYLKHESWAIMRSFIKYWGLNSFDHGIVAGVLRDSETDVSYYYISSTNDRRKPINNITVTLNPGGRVYNGDNYNNGFYMFDSVAPGNYWVVFEHENYEKDSSQVTVTANNTVFADKWMTFITTAAPYVKIYTPNTSDSVFTLTPIDIIFSRSMDTASVRGALTIDPPATGTISWANYNTKLTFTPSAPYEKATDYTVNISTAAKSNWNVNLDSNFTFSFVTQNRNRLTLTKSFPIPNMEDVSPDFKVRLEFDAPVPAPGTKIQLRKMNDEVITIKSISTVEEKGKGVVYFEPSSPLQMGENYKVVIDGSYKDVSNLPLENTIDIPFKTYNYIYTGIVVDSFEVSGYWKNSGYSGSTVGVDTNLSKFVRYTLKKINGSCSGRFTYSFINPSGGLCRFFNAAKPSIGSDPIEFGMWIYGDLSDNILEYWFYYNANQNAIVFADTLNWSGWKMVKIPASEIEGTGEKLFHSLVIKQNPEGMAKNFIYADDAMYNIQVSADETKTFSKYPNSYELHQNYPNPFNPTTYISFALPNETNVSLQIFDILGRSVRTLLNNENYTPGTWRVEWDGKDSFGKIVPSGVYIYRIQTKDFIQSKKMMMLK